MGFQKSYVIVRVGYGKWLRPITRWVGGVKKGQKHAYVIFEWSLSNFQVEPMEKNEPRKRMKLFGAKEECSYY